MSNLFQRLLDALLGRNRPPTPPPPIPVPTPTPEPTPKPDVASGLLYAHNQVRASKGLKPLAGNPKLQAAAQAHSDHMARRGKMAHSGIGDGSPWDRIAATGYAMGAGAENVAMGQRDVAEVMAAWKGSSGHYRNIVGAYREFGGASATGSGGSVFWTTVFASPGVASFGLAPVASGDGAPVESRGGWLIPAATSEVQIKAEDTGRATG